MYVCVCKAVTDSQIKNAVESGACTRKQLFNCLGVGGDCGKCSRHVKEVLDSALQQISANEDSLAA
ncbi:MAG: (2Fe-2S)-binding protein [Methylobacter sp.]|nr:MAG: (2Fe-2S)-binding protein [Methylobacter sp.]PPD05542.1 MAG: (2Fe-2S)-binding protein [Methylobacter sp.]PPD24578.1 MAG: (2Fe-2S)-binding protein [Methylobacter sp.]PPD32150.1 MAG: (2Fe-2S)-binding protein [Methylomonas sp.]